MQPAMILAVEDADVWSTSVKVPQDLHVISCPRPHPKHDTTAARTA